MKGNFHARFLGGCERATARTYPVPLDHSTPFTMSTEQQIQKFADGEVYFWLEQDSSIMLKAASRHGDPVELTADGAREIAAALIATAQKLDSLDSPKT